MPVMCPACGSVTTLRTPEVTPGDGCSCPAKLPESSPTTRALPFWLQVWVAAVAVLSGIALAVNIIRGWVLDHRREQLRPWIEFAVPDAEQLTKQPTQWLTDELTRVRVRHPWPKEKKTEEDGEAPPTVCDKKQLREPPSHWSTACQNSFRMADAYAANLEKNTTKIKVKDRSTASSYSLGK